MVKLSLSGGLFYSDLSFIIEGMRDTSGCYGSYTVNHLNGAFVALKEFRIPMACCAVGNLAKTVGLFALNVLDTTSQTVGLVAWHMGEEAVKWMTGAEETVLSDRPLVRKVVYQGIGDTLLAAGALFVPCRAIQLAALPVLFGSLYGTINNQFTVRECPEYYTMGHYYDGQRLDGHAIKTNNLFIKPFVTGCYATTFVTRISGVFLACVGTLPYAKVPLSLALGAKMMGGVTAVSLLVGHMYAGYAKQEVKDRLEAISLHIGTPLDEEETLSDAYSRATIDQTSCDSVFTHSEEWREKLRELMFSVDENNLPVKYIPKWTANSTRNFVGYVVGGGMGTVAVGIATVFARLFFK